MMMNSLLKFLAWAFSELFLMMYYYPPFFSSSLQIHLQFLVLFHSFLPVCINNIRGDRCQEIKSAKVAEGEIHRELKLTGEEVWRPCFLQVLSDKLIEDLKLLGFCAW